MVECMLMVDTFFLMKKVLGSNLTWECPKQLNDVLFAKHEMLIPSIPTHELEKK
jgi:hypothetical protein